MSESKGTSGSNLGIPALITGLALIVPLAWARLARASTGTGKIPRLAREMPGMGKRKAPPPPEAPAPPVEAPAAPPVEADAPPTVEAASPPTAAPVVAPTPAPPVPAPTPSSALAAPSAPPVVAPTPAPPAAAPTPAPPAAAPAAAIAKPADEAPAPPVPPPVKQPPTPAAAVPTAPAPTAPTPTPMDAEQITTMVGWLDKHAPEYKEAIRKRLTGPGAPPITAMALCRTAIEILPPHLIAQLKRDVPAVVPELAICEKTTQHQPPVSTAAAPIVSVPETEADRVARAETIPLIPSTGPAAPPTPAPVPTAAATAPAPAPAPEPAPEVTPAEAAPPQPPDPAPAPPAPPPVAMPEPEVVAEVSPGPPPATAQLATPKPPEGFDAAKARQLAPQLAKSVAEKKFDYSRKLAMEFQIAAGIDPDKHYGGETRSAVEAFGVRRPPKALFKPTGAVPYKWADYA